MALPENNTIYELVRLEMFNPHFRSVRIQRCNTYGKFTSLHSCLGTAGVNNLLFDLLMGDSNGSITAPTLQVNLADLEDDQGAGRNASILILVCRTYGGPRFEPSLGLCGGLLGSVLRRTAD